MIHQGDALTVLQTLDAASVHCCVTSPPYFGLRDYGVDGQIGLEPSVDDYVAKMVEVFREVRRVLRDDGICWLNLGDSYGGTAGNTCGVGAGGGQSRGEQKSGVAKGRHKGGTAKQLLGIPWRVAFALQADGWWLRQDIIWAKPNPMPESVRDRCTKSHEYLFLLSKSARYYFDAEAIKEPAAHPGQSRSCKKYAENPVQTLGRHTATSLSADRTHRNKRDVWTVATKPYKGAHFACFPPALITPCILAGCPPQGTVLDPFFGSGTTGMVAKQHGRQYVGIELNPEYIRLAKERIGNEPA